VLFGTARLTSSSVLLVLDIQVGDREVRMAGKKALASIHSITAFARHSSESKESFEYYGTAEKSRGSL
jgi:hypothetical protein